jgi:hypothetical protein
MIPAHAEAGKNIKIVVLINNYQLADGVITLDDLKGFDEELQNVIKQ